MLAPSLRRRRGRCTVSVTRIELCLDVRAIPVRLDVRAWHTCTRCSTGCHRYRQLCAVDGVFGIYVSRSYQFAHLSATR